MITNIKEVIKLSNEAQTSYGNLQVSKHFVSKNTVSTGRTKLTTLGHWYRHNYSPEGCKMQICSRISKLVLYMEHSSFYCINSTFSIHIIQQVKIPYIYINRQFALAPPNKIAVIRFQFSRYQREPTYTNSCLENFGIPVVYSKGAF